MGWGFQSLQQEIESLEVDITRCEEMIRIEKQSIKDEIYEASNSEYIINFLEDERGWVMEDTEYRIDDEFEVAEIKDDA